jgi:hypothetical protein
MEIHGTLQEEVVVSGARTEPGSMTLFDQTGSMTRFGENGSKTRFRETDVQGALFESNPWHRHSSNATAATSRNIETEKVANYNMCNVFVDER